MYWVDRTAVVLKPTEVYLAWLKSVDEDLPEITLTQLRSNCTTLLVPQLDTPEAVLAYLGERYRALFEADLTQWEIAQEKWPQDMGLAVFWAFFEAEIHDTVLDLDDADLQVSPVFDNMM